MKMESPELLFESRLNIAAPGGASAMEGKLSFVQGKPKLHAEPVLVGDTDADGGGVMVGTVLRDGGRYRMWYWGIPRVWKGSDDEIYQEYAESDDGIEWKKPTLGIVPDGPRPNNLLNLRVGAIFIDPQAPPNCRYRATGYLAPSVVGVPKGIGKGYFTSHSADGLRWELDSLEPTWPGGDVITSVYHPGQRRGLVALKQGPRYHGIPRRAVWNAELVDGKWSDSWRAMVPDDFDDVCAMARGFVSGDYYGLSMLPAGRSTVGFLWQFRHSLPRQASQKECWEAGVNGANDVTLVFQENAHDCWQHVPGRPDFLAHGCLPHSDGGIYPASGTVECGDEHRLYLNAARFDHGWYIDNSWKVLERWKDEMRDEGTGYITFAHWPKWRLFGFQSNPEGKLSLDLGPLKQPSRLVLNYECEPKGSVRAEIAGQDSRAVEQAQPLTGQSLAACVAWKDGDIITPAPKGGNVKVKLHMERATVWAYEVQPVR